jgi:hypothetical protein
MEHQISMGLKAMNYNYFWVRGALLIIADDSNKNDDDNENIIFEINRVERYL